MNADVLLKYFDRISEAPDAIPRLRRFILDLAVRGKLVEQDSNDEPAAELLKRIRVAKARRIKAGELRSPRSLDWADEIEELFSLPKSWTWIRLADIGAIIGGGTPPSGDYDNFTNGGAGVAWLTPADLGKHDGLYVSHGARDLTDKGLQSSSATLMPKDSVLFTSRAPIGYTAIAANKITTNQGFKSVVPYIVECSRYIAAYLQAFGPWIDSKASGTTFKEVSGKIVSGLPFPLPPLAEQQRIVAKVDELMALCDQLEAARNERESRRQRLTAASLQRLNQPADAAALRVDARFHLDNLTRLTTRPEQIKQLRQTILNLAVRGCLVPQDPRDEPVRASPSNNAPFSLPDSWCWITVGQIGDSRLGKMLDKAKNKGTSRRYLRNVNVRWFDFDLSDVYEMPYEDKEFDEFALRRGDVLICEGGEPGRAAVWDEREAGIFFQKAIHRVRFEVGVDSNYFVNALRESANCGRLSTYFTGVGIKHFTGRGLSSFSFPLPPLAEQHRIVTRVDELMALCDQLEAQLTTTATDSRRLLEAVLRDAIRPQAQG